MLWALASSALVIYLYRSLNAQGTSAPADGPADNVEAELAALDARLAAIESKTEK